MKTNEVGIAVEIGATMCFVALAGPTGGAILGGIAAGMAAGYLFDKYVATEDNKQRWNNL